MGEEGWTEEEDRPEREHTDDCGEGSSLKQDQRKS